MKSQWSLESLLPLCNVASSSGCFQDLFFIFCFILLGVHWAAWICKFRFYTKFEEFSAIISSNIFLPHSLSFLLLKLQLHLWQAFFFFNFYLFIYLLLLLFLAALGLRFCARAFSSCGKRGPLFIVVHGPLTIAASLFAERRLNSCGSRAQLLGGMWDPPRLGLKPVSPTLAGRFMADFLMLSYKCDVLFIFCSIFFFCLFGLDHFYQSVFRFIDSFLYHLHSVKLIQWFFWKFYILYFLVLELPVCSLLLFLFLCQGFLYISYILLDHWA